LRLMPVNHISSEQSPQSELFSMDQLEHHAKALAKRHDLDLRPGKDRLLSRLKENEDLLLYTHKLLQEALENRLSISQASIWFLDNFPKVEEEIYLVRKHLPKSYSRELPHLTKGPWKGLPRVYNIAGELIDHSDGRVDEECLTRFIVAYQSVRELNIGELWAISIMLRLALIENLRGVCANIISNRIDRNLATRWADRIIETADKDPKNMALAVAEMAGSGPPLSSSFVAEITRRLEGQSPILSLPLKWIEEKLSETGITIEQLIQLEIQREAAYRVSVSNCIESFRFIDAMDWRKFAESMSVLERALKNDPSKAYGDMDFATRDRYRHVVETIARNSPFSEKDVALLAVSLSSKRAEAKGFDSREAHVGYFLVDNGLPELERSARMHRSLRVMLRDLGHRYPLFLYIAPIVLITVLVIAGVLEQVGAFGATGWMLILAGIILVLPANSLAVALVNFTAAIAIQPMALPRMDFSKGIPEDMKTLVVLPAVLFDLDEVDKLQEGIEVKYLANQDPNLYFGLLTDLKDAPQEIMPGDNLLLKKAKEGIDALNKKYQCNSFFLFHRSRRWSPQEQVWMGHERKRGIQEELKLLEELNALLLGKPDSSFISVTGETSILQRIKYVIALDADILMPHGSAKLLVGALAHPLNRPRYSNEKQCIVEGYSILQPLIAMSLPEAGTSRLARIFCGDLGIDPYTREVSDSYQNLFGNGSFGNGSSTVNGIYDVDAFSKALDGRLAENRILSHDLLEGCYARAALASDVQFYEVYRGDWQIAVWLLGRVPGPGTLRLINPISGLSRWMIFDRLRRSLVPFASFLLLLLGWVILRPAWITTALVVGIMAIPPILSSLVEAKRLPVELPVYLKMRFFARFVTRSLAQIVLSLIFLPYEAYITLDTVVRSNVRAFITHRRLPEWKTAGESLRTAREDTPGFYLAMWSVPAVAAIIGIYLVLFRPGALYAAGLLLSLWLISPVIAWWIRRPHTPLGAKLTADQTMFLRKVARRTWRFFEEFIGSDNNWLPPDRYQEYPGMLTANDTSPTNMGLSLLANLAAYDFGYISMGRMLDRTANSLRTMAGLERFRGHFYNWYDMKRLKPLQPRYVSTVDSGNLAGHLLVLRQGLLEIPCHKILSPQAFSGIRDTLLVLSDAIYGAGNGSAPPDAMKRIADLQAYLEQPPSDIHGAWEALDKLARAADDIFRILIVSSNKEAILWIESLQHQLHGYMDDLSLLASWKNLHLSDRALQGISQGIDANYEKLRMAMGELERIPTLKDAAALNTRLLPLIDRTLSNPAGLSPKAHSDLLRIRAAVAESSSRAAERIESLERLAAQCVELMDADYDFLFDGQRRLLAVGFNVDDNRRDESFYDLLASEARLTSFMAASRGYLPQDHWFALRRLVTAVDGKLTLLSWGGTMFEYLMPLLVMPTYESTLLDQTYHSAVRAQMRYGTERGVPWGISESGYNVTDTNMVYQYRAFGIPELGLKRGLKEDLVIAPYASSLALMVAPGEACANLQRMVNEGFLGDYGFYEAIDYTRSRLSPGQSSAIIRSFMAHHQGMSFLSLTYTLLNMPMQRRFLSDPAFRAMEPLLQEKIPKVAPLYPHAAEAAVRIWRSGMSRDLVPMRFFTDPSTSMPEVHLLSNGRYSVMITNAGGGYSKWKDLAVTRWHGDTTLDNEGAFIYIRDVETGEFWSMAHQPTLKEPETYKVLFQGPWARFWRRDNGIDVYTEITVSSEDDIELRDIRITNRSSKTRILEVTSYSEVVLASPAAYVQHPAFSNLFVETEILSGMHAILCTRRPSSDKDITPWMIHMAAVESRSEVSGPSYETSRMNFLGRCRTADNPAALIDIQALTSAEGSVLDPIAAIRYTITLGPSETARINFITGVTETREAALDLIEKYQEVRDADRISSLALTHNLAVLKQLNATESEIHLYEGLASALMYPSSTWRAKPEVLRSNKLGQSGLWGYGISGDLPIVLLRIGSGAGIELIRQLLKAHAYWRMMGLEADLVILNEERSGYLQGLQDEIMGMITASTKTGMIDRPGGIFVRRADQISDEAKILLQAVARVVLTDTMGTLADQVGLGWHVEHDVPTLKPTRAPWIEENHAVEEDLGEDLVFFNGLGGFDENSLEYVIKLASNRVTPAPWANVLANPSFGTIVTENGRCYTWSENAQIFRLTPWYNDPITDASGEALYIRDEESSQFWSPTPLPARGSTPYVIRHGFGYSTFEHVEGGVRTKLQIYVALDAPVKLSVLKVRNESGRTRTLSVTGYAELLLGDLRSKTMMHVSTEVDPVTGALFASNYYNSEFPGRIAFLDADEANRTVTGDRTEFLGRNGTASNPAAMKRARLSGNVGTALDPCAAIQIPFTLADGEEREVVFTLGCGKDREEARNLVRRFRDSGLAKTALEDVRSFWNRTLGVMHLETPDKAVNIMANGWLLYQTLTCRVWARTGYYQSSGAFGFRDQLQDVMALLYTKPSIAREHLLLSGAHQFVDGDVQHWWHPPIGRGVRTHISDDYLWLPLAATRYVDVTGDMAVLDELVGYIEGRLLKPDEDAYYDLPTASTKYDTLYRHCVKSINRALELFGPHGLPLMGTGDWNDGMNRVGNHGQGESIWLAFFLYKVLTDFSMLAQRRGDQAFAKFCAENASLLQHNIEASGWDGKWYLRAYYDNGEPLGSSRNLDCKIDSLPQSWSVLSGAGDFERSRIALNSVDRLLVRRDARLIQLLDPPFDKAALNPGYIKGYVPGVRENGGHYTHAAVWVVMAYATMGYNQKAWELFSMINPINRSFSASAVETYKVEPYVVAGDIYSVPPHVGRGGWTWYTGSAGWMYRLIIESLIGIVLEGNKLRLAPCPNPGWQSFKLRYRYRETFYHLTVVQTGSGHEVLSVTLDGKEQTDKTVTLVDDQKNHYVEIRI
jgi:cyclic beta-1,2-glucan synthetase